MTRYIREQIFACLPITILICLLPCNLAAFFSWKIKREKNQKMDIYKTKALLGLSVLAATVIDTLSGVVSKGRWLMVAVMGHDEASIGR
jgi:hypothetical protein